MALEELQNGRYRRLRLLGSGGMGEVYLMDDKRVNRQVAIKVIRSEGAPYPDSDASRDAARLFQREAKAIAALEHPNILPLYDFGEETLDGTTITYMVMPFSTEGSLAGWLQQRGNATMLSLQDLTYLIEQAAEALQYAHDHQVIHLDVKPSNFLLRSNKRNPNRPTLLLADFGIARSSATAASSSRTIRGTPTSMAPEQWSSQPVPASDQYALAVMAYEMLTGRPPFVGGMEQLMYQHFSAQPPPPSAFNTQLPAAIDSVILRALAKKPEDRFPSIAAFASAFEHVAHLAPAVLAVQAQVPTAIAIQATLAISQAEAQAGTSRMITLPGGQQIAVAIPAGVSDGQVIRLPGLGEASNPVILTVVIKRPEEAPLPSDARSAEQTFRSSQPDVQQSFDRVSGHDLPTIAASGPSFQAPERQQPQQPPPLPKRRRASGFRIISILSGLIILLLLGGAVYYYSSRQSNGNQANLNTNAHSQTATAKPAQTPTLTQTVAVSPTATPHPGLYIAGTYNGSMVDETTQQTISISVFIVQSQGNGVFSGKFTFRSPSQGVYPLNGNVDTQGNFSFTVQQPAGQKPLYFHGKVQQGDYLQGNFCRSSTNSCSVDTGYFTVGPRF